MNEFEKRDPGTYTGHDPDLAPEKVPGGVRPHELKPDAWSSGPDPAWKPEPPADGELQESDDDAADHTSR
jgi:hypothetical protein